ncbi:hypothetical protein AA637_13875 [Cyanobacterium sp. HL-69]|uniref:hypothetical protein n=1 Tax=unclassified Cyanobacterium TaxID=2629879 RepID=UPI0008527AC6|nr:hypothetical protein [Cyanobacterium sp. IPPAS B-1200]AUC62165.1 hypothetical protein AA637_13875 [Cyanobacterium sp. HL-69]OEJ79871.1 hypothetical protein A5482_08395 [Cyanobacterium sp. IPPAS B-1200]
MSDNWENQDHNQEENQETSALEVANKATALFHYNRPIKPSSLEVVSTYQSVGSTRPITKSHLNVRNTLVLSGSRPITAGTLQISEQYNVMGNRPVASNEIDDVFLLMGYLD